MEQALDVTGIWIQAWAFLVASFLAACWIGWCKAEIDSHGSIASGWNYWVSVVGATAGMGYSFCTFIAIKMPWFETARVLVAGMDLSFWVAIGCLIVSIGFTTQRNVSFWRWQNHHIHDIVNHDTVELGVDALRHVRIGSGGRDILKSIAIGKSRSSSRSNRRSGSGGAEVGKAGAGIGAALIKVLRFIVGFLIVIAIFAIAFGFVMLIIYVVSSWRESGMQKRFDDKREKYELRRRQQVAVSGLKIE